ncbi:MAG: Rpn family recombination-promoting nuclease/putative transposase [Cyanobacteria bacterium J06642_2]
MFDNVCRYLAERYSPDIASWLLGRAIAFTKLSPTELSLQPIRADSLILLESEDLIFHAEFQTAPDDGIPFRMADYALRLFRRFPTKTLHQVVVYLRETNSLLVYQSAFERPTTRHEFEVIRLWEEPVEKFLTVPGLLPFAVLARSSDREAVLRQVSQQVEEIGDRTQQSDIAASAEILAGLVLSKEAIRGILRSDIMKESVIYQEIQKEGIEKGRAEGRAENTRELAVKMLENGIDASQVVAITGLTPDQVLGLQAQK